MSKLETMNYESIFPYSKWQPQLSALRKRYETAQPYPHIVLENFLEQEALEKGLAQFPGVKSGEWIQYLHVNERKFGKNDLASLPPALKSIIETLNSDSFVQFLSELTGIQGLFADRALEGGGLHQSQAGGFLNIHADFTVHPHHRDWQRRVNVLVYLNKNWQDSYKGHLELWDRKMEHCIEKVAPIFNRCVIFNTDADAFHGHPDKLQCPEGETRKSIALYYFTKEENPMARSTEYRGRPDDGVKKVWIYLDKMALRTYDWLKRKTGISDKFVSHVLGFFDRLKRK